MAKVLIVDDSELIQSLIETWLRGMGHETVSVYDGNSAAPGFAHHKPDLVILDYQMPAAFGTQVLERIRSLEGGASVPVVFLSGDEPTELEHKVADRKLVRFLQKPIQEKQFRSTIEELLQQQGFSASNPA